ncbi:hypothetical protein ACTVZO_00085 [Streptomyces sp. IBSNAI002]|uniref:hypothetical protein n=1 Tax=Streptomyces sp. IBSNAI002 TaxID=3457500 RepID=UPI003FCFA270
MTRLTSLTGARQARRPQKPSVVSGSKTVQPVAQEGTLCYAAAAATAYQWAGINVSLYEMMHAYLISEWAEHSIGAKPYREAVHTIPGWETMAASDIIEIIKRDNADVFSSATLLLGIPVMTLGTVTQIALSSANLKKHIASNQPIIVSEANHWRVVYGILEEGDTIVGILVFNPARGGYYETVQYPLACDEAFAVGC